MTKELVSMDFISFLSAYFVHWLYQFTDLLFNNTQFH